MRVSSQTNIMDTDNIDDELILDATDDLSSHDVGSRSPSPGSVCFRTPQQSVAYITQGHTGAVPQIQTYAGPTQVVGNVQWAQQQQPPAPTPLSIAPQPQPPSAHWVYIDFYARDPDSTPANHFLTSTNAIAPAGHWCTNLMFFTKLLKWGAAVINKSYPYKLFKSEGYEVLLRKPEFLYYYKDNDDLTLSLFRFNHPMSAAIRAEAPPPFPMSNGQQPFTKITAYVDLEFRYTPRRQIGVGDPMIRDILQSIQKAKEQWVLEANKGTAPMGSASTSTTPTPTPVGLQEPERPQGKETGRQHARAETPHQRVDRKRNHPDLRQELERRTDDRSARTYKMRPN